MNKLEMAQEYALKMLENLNPMQMDKPTRDGIAYECFELAEAMLDEDDKRKTRGLPDVLKLADSPQLNNESILHDIDCYFDNQNNTKRDADNLIQSIYEHLTGEVRADIGINDVGEWQPDWSQAPRGDVTGWKMKTKEQAIWLAQDGGYYLAPSFNYQGSWQDSLRKRPNT